MQAVENQKYVQYGLWDDDYNLLLLSLNNGMTGTGIYVTFRGIESYSITLQSIVHCMQQGESGPTQPLSTMDQVMGGHVILSLYFTTI